jgi:hypothetical protein
MHHLIKRVSTALALQSPAGFELPPELAKSPHGVGRVAVLSLDRRALIHSRSGGADHRMELFVARRVQLAFQLFGPALEHVASRRSIGGRRGPLHPRRSAAPLI